MRSPCRERPRDDPNRASRLHKPTREFRAEFLALSPELAPRMLDASQVLEGLTPNDVCEGVEGVRVGQTLSERAEAVTRIVCQRLHASVRVREEETVYSELLNRQAAWRPAAIDPPPAHSIAVGFSLSLKIKTRPWMSAVYQEPVPETTCSPTAEERAEPTLRPTSDTWPAVGHSRTPRDSEGAIPVPCDCASR